ncbi:MAG: YdcF family protein [Steroidobacteraceae bacterium]|jgi:uncharacterized SAM-binding protein YcdF (DUF218 family)
MTDMTALEHAARLWTYMSSMRAHDFCDAVVLCCSYDLRVCDYACELIKNDVAPCLVLTGNTGNWTKHLWKVPEAHIFRDRALANGIESNKIHLEDRATNFGENIAFVRKLLPDLRRVTFVTKPASVLRVALTVPVQWPGVTAFVDSPGFSFPEEVSNVIGVFGIMHEMVGDIDRVIQYPARGFQVPHRLPPAILESWQALKAEGFGHHLLTSPA